MMVATKLGDLRGEMLFQESLARYTSWRIGGPARCLYRPADRADLLAFLRGLPVGEPLLWLGLGSNLLVRDGGFAGTVIVTQGHLNEMQQTDDNLLRVEAGVSCARVARFAARAGLCGAEFLSGIPGTMGGALAMNAGAFGYETWHMVERVETLDRYGEVRLRNPEDFTVGYRKVTGPPEEWFLTVLLRLQPGDSNAASQGIKQLLERRNSSQPIGLPSCGSVFRNPTGDHAARLIEAAGLKGLRVGGAQVSEKHANFVINTGQATAVDVEELIAQVRDRVEQATGIRLVPEVHIVGETASES